MQVHETSQPITRCKAWQPRAGSAVDRFWTGCHVDAMAAVWQNHIGKNIQIEAIHPQSYRQLIHGGMKIRGRYNSSWNRAPFFLKNFGSPKLHFYQWFPLNSSKSPYLSHLQKWSMNINILLKPPTIIHNPDSKVHGANMGPIWGRQDPGGPHVGPMNFAIWECFHMIIIEITLFHKITIALGLYFDVCICYFAILWRHRQLKSHLNDQSKYQ